MKNKCKQTGHFDKTHRTLYCVQWTLFNFIFHTNPNRYSQILNKHCKVSTRLSRPKLQFWVGIPSEGSHKQLSFIIYSPYTLHSKFTKPTPKYTNTATNPQHKVPMSATTFKLIHHKSSVLRSQRSHWHQRVAPMYLHLQSLLHWIYICNISDILYPA